MTHEKGQAGPVGSMAGSAFPTYAEMHIGFREAVRRIAAKPIDSSDMMDEIEHLLSLLPNNRSSATPEKKYEKQNGQSPGVAL